MSMMVEQEKDDDREDSGAKGPLSILGVIFLPAVAVGGLFYAMLRFGKQKPSVIGLAVAIYEVAVLVTWFLTDAWGQLMGVVSSPGSIGETWVHLLPAIILVNLFLAGPVGLLFVSMQMHQIRTSPHLIHLSGSWLYRFEHRRAPWDVWRRRRRIRQLHSGALSSPERAPLGLDEQNGDVVAYRYMSEAVRQTLITGAAGSGKSITMLSMILSDIKSHLPVVVVDFKRSSEFASKLAAWAAEEGCEFYHFVNGDGYDVEGSKGQCTYDPLVSGGAGKADMLLGMREYDDAAAVYKSTMRQLLQVLFAMFRSANRQRAHSVDWGHGGISQVASSVNGNLAELAAACEGTPIQVDAETIARQAMERTSNMARQVTELQGQMRTLLVSEYGPWLRPSAESRNIDLYELTSRPGNVILFSLNADSEKDFSRYMGSLIMADLNAVSARRRNAGDQNQVNVYVDEFQAVPPTALTSLLEKSRQSHLAMTLASQSFEQIVSSADRNGEAYLLGILDTSSNFVIHSGATEDSAERVAKILGKHMQTVYSQAKHNQSFLFSLNWKNRRKQTVQSREEERWVVEPKDFMRLSAPTKNNGFRATAMLINKSSDDPLFRGHEGAMARKVWMIPDDRVTAQYHEPRLHSMADDPYGAEVESTLEATDPPENLLGSHGPLNLAKATPQDLDSFTDPEQTGDSEEELDGGYGWENEMDDAMGEALSIPLGQGLPSVPNVAPGTDAQVMVNSRYAPGSERPKDRFVRSALEETSFTNFQNRDFKPQVRSTQRPTPRYQPVDDDALPGLDDDGLPPLPADDGDDALPDFPDSM